MDTALTWLRPEWLWGLLPLLLMLIIWVRRKVNAGVWESIVDPALQPYVIEGDEQSRSLLPIGLFAAWALALVLLAGPVWTQQEVPVFQAEQSEVLVLDLSRSMRADDVAPDRLTRARFKLLDLLRNSEGRQTGLIAFAERPYVISPLTEDAGTVEAFVPSLEPEVMPVQGSRLDLAINKAVDLLAQAGVAQGHIIVISDAVVNERDKQASSAARDAGHRLSVIAVGTPAGAPLRDSEGQFFQQANGAIIVPQLDFAGMQTLASLGGGLAVRMSAGSEDLATLQSVRRRIAINADENETASEKIYWVEYSPWFLWLLVAAMLVAFRRGVIT